MKRAELVFSAILVPVDYLMIIVAGLMAYRLRFWEIATLRPVVYELPFNEYISIVFIVGIIWLIVFALSGLYSIKSTRRFFDEFVKIVLACSTGFLSIIVLIFFQRELFSSRFIILAGWLLAILFITVSRLLIRRLQHSFFLRGYGIRNIIMVGSDESTVILKDYLMTQRQLGYRIVGSFSEVNDQNIQDLKQTISQKEIDEIILADPNTEKKERMLLLDISIDNHIGFKYMADLLDAKISNVHIETIAGRPLIEIKRTPLDGWGRIMKRISDTLFSTLGVIVLSPFFLIIALIIKIDSKGPVFVRLDRVGEGNKVFQVYKFRSMVDNAHTMKNDLMKYNERADGPLFKMKEDPRITKSGKFMRRMSIDELPQLFNVLKGEMSLVGPRPHEPEEVSRYQKSHKKLLAIKPGITGLAQISGRSELNFSDEARLDIYYIENWSPLIDVKILMRTPLVVLSTKSAS
ncbi:sugar transferase [Patescibacteria group bacterium]|nr:sugar transferase [Patescibacteria group bacterium]MBU1889899.1 sugar transferase [Patescibacteria group bacterium]